YVLNARPSVERYRVYSRRYPRVKLRERETPRLGSLCEIPPAEGSPVDEGGRSADRRGTPGQGESRGRSGARGGTSQRGGGGVSVNALSPSLPGLTGQSVRR